MVQENSVALGVARSFAGRAWGFAPCDEPAAKEIALRHGLSPVLARLIAARGIAAEDVPDFLHPTLRRCLPEPRGLADMDKAVERVRTALAAGEAMAIYGDYDVDGSCSSALLSAFLTAVGGQPRLYVPDRMTEGYGPNTAALLKLQAEGVRLILTVDCGAGAAEPLAAAQAAGVDVVVLDHHACDAPPVAFAHVNPNRPGDASGLTQLCATAVVFLFCIALNRALRAAGWYADRPEPDLRQSLDLVGLATVCDVVPLVGVNRLFVRSGLALMNALHRPGLAALANVAGVTTPFTAYHLGFVLGPRINAGGRVGRCGLGADLLMADPAAAASFAQALDGHNRERQALEAIILEEAEALAAMQDGPFVLVAAAGWHPGVVGIVAGRLKEKFGKPAFVAGFEGGLGRGSARSVSGVNLGAMVRAACEAGVLEAGGGHAMAAGFSLRSEQVEAFRAFLTAHFAEYGQAEGEDVLNLDVVVSPSGATPALMAEMENLGPFGAGNAEPVVGVPALQVKYADVVGKDHVRLRLAGADGVRLDAIAWRAAQTDLGRGLLAARGQAIHVAGHLRLNVWNGRTSVQLQVADAASASA